MAGDDSGKVVISSSQDVNESANTALSVGAKHIRLVGSIWREDRTSVDDPEGAGLEAIEKRLLLRGHILVPYSSMEITCWVPQQMMRSSCLQRSFLTRATSLRLLLISVMRSPVLETPKHKYTKDVATSTGLLPTMMRGLISVVYGSQLALLD